MAGNMDENTDSGISLEPYIESLRQQLEDQDQIFLIGVLVALAVVIITCGALASWVLAC